MLNNVVVSTLLMAGLLLLIIGSVVALYSIGSNNVWLGSLSVALMLLGWILLDPDPLCLWIMRHVRQRHTTSPSQ